MKYIQYSFVFFMVSIFPIVLLGTDREVAASRVESAPKIDGKLDDLVWKKGVWFTDFSLLSDPTELAKVQMEFQVAYDDEYLYLVARMDEPESGCLKIEEFRKDGSVSRDDSVEVMIDPYGDRYEYYHFITNPVGIRYDAKRSHGGEFHDIAWDSNWKVATKIGSNEWTFEMAIPFSELNLNKKSEGPWAFSIARNRCVGKKREISSFGPMKGSLHDAQTFSKLHVNEPNLSRFFWGIKRPFDYYIEADKGDWVLNGKVQVKNDGSPVEKFKLLFKQVDKKGAIVLDVLTDLIPIGGGKEYTFRFPVEKQEPLELQFEIVGVENAKEIYRVKKVLLDIDYRPMSLKLLNPSYRNTIYPNEVISELKMMVRLALAPKVLSGSKLQIRLLGEKAVNFLPEIEITKLSNVQEVSLPVGNLAPGRYILEAQLFGNKGDIIARYTELLNKLRHEEHEWRLDQNGGLLYNGELFLPRGWFDILPGEMQLANANGSLYNALFMPNNIITDGQDANKFLDSVLKAKGYAIMYPYPNDDIANGKQNVVRPLTINEVKAIQQRVKALKKHPALMAWVIAYEPEFNSVLPSRMKQVYAIIAEEDPFHPAIIVHSSIGSITKYLGMSDIMMTETLIPFLKGEGATRPIDSVSYYLDMANKMSFNRVAFWAGLQAYDYSGNWNDSIRIPSFVELRNMLFQSVIGGVKGFFWNNFPYNYNYPEVRIGIDHLAKELAVLKDAVLAEKDGEKVIIECNDKNFIYFSKRLVGNDRFLFVVNTGSFSQNVKFKAPVFDGLDKLFVFCEKRTLQVSNGGVFSDNFEPYATHVYVSKAIDSELTTLNEVKAAIDAANKSRKKTGNLAFEDSGVKITTSSSYHPSFISKLNDGILGGVVWMASRDEELPQWIEFSWPKLIRVEKVVIYSDSIESAKVQIKRDNAWVDIAEFKRRSGAHLRAMFKEAELSRMRILITEKKPGVETITVSEIEVYNSSTQELER